jgi:hypothetical protein
MSKSAKWFRPEDAMTKDMTPLVIQSKPSETYQNTILQQIMEKPYVPPRLLPPQESKERCSVCSATLTKPESIQRKLCFQCSNQKQRSNRTLPTTQTQTPTQTQTSRILSNLKTKPIKTPTTTKVLYITKQIAKNEKDQVRCPMCLVTPSNEKRKSGTLCDYCKKTFLNKRKMFCRDCRTSLVNVPTFYLCLCLSSYCVECVKKGEKMLPCDCTKSCNLIEFNKV